YGEVPEKKGGLMGLWIALGSIVALALVYLLVAFLMKLPPFQPSLQSLINDCETGNAQACEDLYQRSEEGTAEERFGETCGGRADGHTTCDQVDMSTPAHSYTG
ncbi:MAG: hypothetical protein Q4G64_07115, partial [bacterium]|nr:hypothetical protein [bacterium]